MKKRIVYLLIGIFMVSLSVHGQNQETNLAPAKGSETTVKLVRNIYLEKDSKTEEVIIDVKQKTQRFQMTINSYVLHGKITIEVYDPNETKKGNYTVETQLSSAKQEMVNGNITKSLTEPQAGKWKVRIIPADASGNIAIHTSIDE